MMKFAALLISRQPSRPHGGTPWVQACVEAIDWIRSEGLGVVSSTGMQTWELVTSLASVNKLRLRLLVPTASERELIVARATYTLHFGLERDAVEFLPVFGGEDRAEAMAQRDAAVVEAADVLIPISIRRGGGMSKLAKEAESRGCAVDRRFEVPYEAAREPHVPELTGSELSDEMREFKDDYLVHWTRAAVHAWPDERLIDYYSDVINHDVWPRSGFDALKRIVGGGRIIASSRHMPARVATVSFSALRPIEALPLMKWRARYGQMTFEPYGVGLRTEQARRFGIRSVNYYDKNEILSVDPLEMWLWQSRGMISDWTAEKEYRCRGDLIIRSMPESSVVLFSRTADEAGQLRRLYPYRVISFLR